MPVLFNNLPVFDYPHKEGLPARHHVSHLIRATNVRLCKFYSEVISAFEFPGVRGRVILNRNLMQSM